jgi:hypothetical protein
MRAIPIMLALGLGSVACNTQQKAESKPAVDSVAIAKPVDVPQNI